MAHKNRHNKGFTLAEIMITIAVMGITLALVATFSAMASKATGQRSEVAARIHEIDRVNDLISTWFYSFDDTDYKMLKVNNEGEKYIYDYVKDKAIRINPSEFTIQNKKFNSMIEGGIVPVNYQLRFNIDSSNFSRVITAVYSADHSKDKSISLNYITNIDFEYQEELKLLKCIYTYDDPEMEHQSYTYTLVLSSNTGN